MSSSKGGNKGVSFGKELLKVCDTANPTCTPCILSVYSPCTPRRVYNTLGINRILEYILCSQCGLCLQGLLNSSVLQLPYNYTARTGSGGETKLEQCLARVLVTVLHSVLYSILLIYPWTLLYWTSRKDGYGNANIRSEGVHSAY
jgi:hypothetical protein